MTQVSVSIPIVDLTPFRQRTAESRHVVETIRRTCEDIGFFVITGHGVPDELISHMYTTSRAFFDLPTEDKRRVQSTGDVQGGLTFFPSSPDHIFRSVGDVLTCW